MRSIADDRSRWRVHVLSEWADRPLSSVTSSEARDWLSRLASKRSSNPTHRKRERLLAASTLKNILNLARAAWQSATDEGLCHSNPFAGLRVRRSRHARTHDVWTVLRLNEQSVLAVLPPVERMLARFAMGSGLRQGEQWGLRLVDVDLYSASPSIMVRYGRPLGPTKSGKPRPVPLFGIALAAMRAWIAMLPTFAPVNPHGLVFPRADGSPRRKGRVCRAWDRVGRILGRSIRWHDLRHTCGSSLVGGWWGPAWSLEEVRCLLGHSSITMTERYAHFAGDALSRASARMHQSEAETKMENACIQARSPLATPCAFAESSITGPGDAIGAIQPTLDEGPTSSAGTSLSRAGHAPPLQIGSTSQIGVQPIRHLSSAVEQRFRNPDGFASGRTVGGDDDERDAAALARILTDLSALPKVSRERVIAALRAAFPGSWPGDKREAGER